MLSIFPMCLNGCIKFDIDVLLISEYYGYK